MILIFKAWEKMILILKATTGENDSHSQGMGENDSHSQELQSAYAA